MLPLQDKSCSIIHRILTGESDISDFTGRYPIYLSTRGCTSPSDQDSGHTGVAPNSQFPGFAYLCLLVRIEFYLKLYYFVLSSSNLYIYIYIYLRHLFIYIYILFIHFIIYLNPFIISTNWAILTLLLTLFFTFLLIKTAFRFL